MKNKKINMMKKYIKYFLFLSILLICNIRCSEDLMDNINQERNNAPTTGANNMLPTVIMRTAFETTGTDIAWYASTYIEHNTGQWGQHYDADRRLSQQSTSLLNNSWNNCYRLIGISRDILDKTSPTGPEPTNFTTRGITQIMFAYNMAVVTDMWGDVPYDDAGLGVTNLKPKYELQKDIYPKIIALLDDAIVNLGKTANSPGTNDYIYGGTTSSWIKAAWSLKARYNLRLSNRDPQAATKALACVPNGFASQAEALMFAKYEATAVGENPWVQFRADRTHFAMSLSLYNLMNARSDPRVDLYWNKIGGVFKPAPNGSAIQQQSGYSTSLKSVAANQTLPTPLMTYHELKFIEAEARRINNDVTYKTALQAAIVANFVFNGSTAAAANTYFTANVDIPSRLDGTLANDIKEIITQKYIAFYEHEAIEAYNDYRRTGYPAMTNPNNATIGFPQRYPYALSEESNNSANMPVINNYVDKVWWAK
jgi:hypothetical protein